MRPSFHVLPSQLRPSPREVPKMGGLSSNLASLRMASRLKTSCDKAGVVVRVCACVCVCMCMCVCERAGGEVRFWEENRSCQLLGG